MDNRWISMVELLLEGAQDSDRQSGEHSRERKIGVRIRQEFPLTDDAKMVLRGQPRQSHQDDADFLYYYLKPSFKHAFRHFEMTLGYRLVHGIEASQAHDLQKFRIGPGIDLTERSEIEFRWTAGRAAGICTPDNMSAMRISSSTRSGFEGQPLAPQPPKNAPD